MTRIAALLSAVNVGGRKARSADLRAIAEALGWRDVETLLASGNIIADIGRISPAAAARKLEDAIAGKLGFRATAILRTGEDLADVIARNPYRTFRPNLMLVNFLTDAPSKTAIAAFDAHIAGAEDYVIDGREMFIRCESGIAGTKITPAVVTRKLGVVGTGRNWNTVLKLRERAERAE